MLGRFVVRGSGVTGRVRVVVVVVVVVVVL